MIKFYEEQVNFNNECLFSKRKISYWKTYVVKFMKSTSKNSLS